MKPEINYQPLEQLKDYAFDGNVINLGILMALAKKYLLPIVTGLMVIITISFVVTVFGGLPNGLQVFMYLIFFVGALAAYLSYRQFAQIEKIAWREFAAANGWQVSSSVYGLKIAPPSVNKLGHSHRSSEVIGGNLEGGRFYLYSHTSTIGHDKTAHDVSATIMEMDLANGQPRLLVVPKNTTYATDLNAKMKLEGDFNKYFHVFSEKGDDIDELVILTPDVMQVMIEKGQAYSIEISGGWLYVMVGGDLRNQNDLPGLIDYGQMMHAQIIQNLPLARLKGT